MQHLGGAVTERLATTTADALYAAYRMARLGIIVMDLCRPIPFREDEVPSVTSLVGNVTQAATGEREVNSRHDVIPAVTLPLQSPRLRQISAIASSPRRRCASSMAIRSTWIPNQPPDAVVFPQAHRRRARRSCAFAPRTRAGDRVRRRHLAGRPRQRAVQGGIVDRLPRHEPRARRACRGPRLRGRARHHAQGAQRASARPGPVLSDRSGRRCLARRHGGDALLRHQCGALRHHEGQRAGAESRARERRADGSTARRGKEILRRL